MGSEIPSCVAILLYLRIQSLKLEKTKLAGTRESTVEGGGQDMEKECQKPL